MSNIKHYITENLNDDTILIQVNIIQMSSENIDIYRINYSSWEIIPGGKYSICKTKFININTHGLLVQLVLVASCNAVSGKYKKKMTGSISTAPFIN